MKTPEPDQSAKATTRVRTPDKDLLCAKIVAELKAAGRHGLRRGQLLAKLGLTAWQLRVALAHHCKNNRKRGDRLEQIGGRYGRYKIWARPKVRAGYGELKAELLAELKTAGEKGIRVRTLAKKLGLSNLKLGKWFATTGKHCPEVERLTRGVYRLSVYRLRLAPCKRAGELTAAILAELEAAGEAGIKNSELADRLGLRHKQTANWFYYTAKNLKCVERIASGTYRLNGQPAVAAVPAAAGREDVRPAVRRRRGVLTAAILAELKAAGEAGIRTEDLAAKVGTSVHNASVWFQNAGRRIHEIERVGLGAYRYNPGCFRPSPGPSRGRIATKVLPALEAAGTDGIRIKDLAVTLGMSNGKLGMWFAKTGKNCPDLERLARGVYRLRPAA